MQAPGSQHDQPDPGPLTGFLVQMPDPRTVRLRKQSLRLRQAVSLIEDVAKDRQEGDPDILGHLAIAMAGTLDANSVLLEATR